MVAIILFSLAILSSFSTLTTCPNYGVHYSLAGVLAKTDNRGFGKLSAVQISRLNSYLTEFGAKSLAQIGQYLEDSFGVSYTIGGLSDLCIRLKIKLKTARPRNYRQDEAAVERYKKTLAV